MNPKALSDFLDALVLRPEFQPRNNRTYCNRASVEVCHFFGVRDFDIENLLADGMVNYLEGNLSGCWSRIDYEFASQQAQEGNLVFAALGSWVLNEDHGHIAACYPSPMQESGSLGHPVPMLANCGRVNGILKSSEVFPVKVGMPRFFLFVNTIRDQR